MTFTSKSAMAIIEMIVQYNTDGDICDEPTLKLISQIIYFQENG